MFAVWLTLVLGSGPALAEEPRTLVELTFQREVGVVKYQALANGAVLKRINDRVVALVHVPKSVLVHDLVGLLADGLEILRDGKGVDVSRCVESEVSVVLPKGQPFRLCEDSSSVREILRARAEAFEMVIRRTPMKR